MDREFPARDRVRVEVALAGSVFADAFLILHRSTFRDGDLHVHVPALAPALGGLRLTLEDASCELVGEDITLRGRTSAGVCTIRISPAPGAGVRGGISFAPVTALAGLSPAG